MSTPMRPLLLSGMVLAAAVAVSPIAGAEPNSTATNPTTAVVKPAAAKVAPFIFRTSRGAGNASSNTSSTAPVPNTTMVMIQHQTVLGLMVQSQQVLTTTHTLSSPGMFGFGF